MKLSTGAALALFAACAVALPGGGGYGPSKKPKGFAYTDGWKFQLDGDDFLFAGTNAYWLPFLADPKDLDVAFSEAKKAGLKVIRTWGFNDKNETYIPGGLPQYGGEGAGASPVYFQSWKNGKATINYGPSGLQAFDRVVKAAEKSGVKILVALTNNWADYGGMDVYTVNLGGKYHDDFYSSPKIIAAFQKYVKAVVTRYKDSPAIFAWELANEPRCGADGTRNLPRSTTCDYKVMGKWISTMGKFIKSIDKNHMVTWGGEGEFHQEGNPDWAYAGADGGNFVEEMQIPQMDFGTFHAYPDWWSKTAAWTNQWIADHGAVQRQLNKPVLFEEYGWLHDAERLAWLGRTVPANETRVAVISAWQKIALQYRMADMYWQFGTCKLSFGCNHNDGFTIFNNDSVEAKPLIYDHAKLVNKVNERL